MYDRRLQIVDVPIDVRMNRECISVAINQEIKVTRFIVRHCRKQKLDRRIIEGTEVVGLEFVIFIHCWCLRQRTG